MKLALMIQRIAIALIFLGVSCSQQPDAPRSYKEWVGVQAAHAPAEHAEDAKLHWHSPADWQEQPASGMRAATFTFDEGECRYHFIARHGG